MVHIALYEPEIPPNTGNIIRLCANTGFTLHLIEPLGFKLEDKQLRRAGLDYEEWARVITHTCFEAFTREVLHEKNRLYACSTKGQRCYTDATFQPNDVLLFGPETRGLPMTLLSQLEADQILRLPMQANSRSLNLSNAAAVMAYEAWRQLGFRTL